MLFLTLAAIFACSYGYILQPLPEEDRIVGGQPADITEAPYQVALLQDNGNGVFEQVCGGSIIRENIILTAAHCTWQTTAPQWKIRAGSSLHNSGGVVIGVDKITQHQSYTHKLDYDICLLQLSSSLTLGPAIAKINLPEQDEAVTDGAPAFITGWGVLTENGVHPVQLQKVTIPIVNQEVCKNAYANVNPITERMICAGKMGVGGQDACQRDSGGPLAIGGKIIGVTSFGRGCADPNFPGVWARVPVFRNWVNSNM